MADDAALEYQDWQLIGDTYYSKTELYDLQTAQSTGQHGTALNLGHMRVFPGSYGGPIAALRDESKVVLHLGAMSRPDIYIYSASGTQVARILWDQGRVITAGWTLTEQLVVVDERGKECEDQGLELAAVCDSSIIGLTLGGSLWCIADIDEPRAHRYPDPVGDVHCICPIPPSKSLSGSLEVLVAVDNTLVLIDADQASPSTITDGPIMQLAVSSDGRYVAGFAADSTIHIWSADLADAITQVGEWETVDDAMDVLGLDGAPDGFPDDISWCGSDAVVVFWEGFGALLITLDGGWRWWDVGSGPAALVSDIDCLRIITTDRHYLLRQVPLPVVSVLESGSTSPGALLYDARRLYEARDARAAAELVEVLHAGDLPEAVVTCLMAAAHELDVKKQEDLMRAGCYGRAFLALSVDSNTTTAAAGLGSQDTVVLARKLRVLNALMDLSVAMPLTMKQLDSLSVQQVADKLVARGHYLLALRMCRALEASQEQVLVQWACDKIAASAASIPDNELVAALRAKLDNQSGVKWALIAAHAQQQGRRSLATALLEQEKSAADQVPLLLDLGEDERALRKALASGDGDLIFRAVYTLYRRQERTPNSKFWAMLRSSPTATAVLAQYLQCQGDGLYEEMLIAVNDHQGLADLKLQQALEAAAPADGGGATESQVHKQLLRVKDEYTKTAASTTSTSTMNARDLKGDAQAVAHYIKLREIQMELQTSSGREGFIGLSVVDTVKQCLRLGMKDQAQKLAKEFKVPEKQFMLLSLQGLAAAHDWAALQYMASKIDRSKAPVSMENFVAACRAHGAPINVSKYFVERIVGEDAVAIKAQLYTDLGLHQEAAMLAGHAELQGGSASVLGSVLGGAFGRLTGGQSG